MSAPRPMALLGPRPMFDAALSGALRGAAHTRFLADLAALAQQEAAITLRLAMVLACIKQLDVSVLGYSGFLALCRERVDWCGSWVRALVRLVESPLEQVKAAAIAGALPLRVAVAAPGKVSVDQQAAWLGGQVLGGAVVEPRATFHEGDAQVIEQARELARICMGRTAVSTAQVDAYILRHWAQHVPGEALSEGRMAPPAPQPKLLSFTWAAHSAPAEGLFGPWQPPADLHAALVQLEAVQAVRRGRLVALARAFAMVHHHALWVDDFDSPWHFAERVMGWSRSTAARYRKLGWGIEWFPQLDAAVRQGLQPESACQIGWLCDTDWQCNRWLRIARHVGQQELMRATAHHGSRLRDYERALAIAQRHAAELLGPTGPGSHPAGTVAAFWIGQADSTAPIPEPGGPCGGGAGAGTAESGAGTGSGAGAGESSAGTGAPGAPRLRIALPLPEPQVSVKIRAHADLLRASRWFVAHNQPCKLSGFAAAKDRTRYQCQNPECGRRTLRVAVHHAHWRRHGGEDVDENAVVLCLPCHLRGIHTRDERIRVSRVVVEGLQALFWEYPGRAPVLQFQSVPP